MIMFEHVDGDLRKAMFGGDIPTLCADICLEVTLIYGAMKRKNEDAAKEFKKVLLSSFFDDDIASKVFSTEVYDMISDSGAYAIGEVCIDAEEFMRQLKELRDSEN